MLTNFRQHLKITSLIFGLITFSFTIFGQTVQKNKTDVRDSENWWKPLIKLHQVISSKNYSNAEVYETGRDFVKNDSLIIIKDAVILVNSGNEYRLFKSKEAIHHLKSNKLEIKEGTEESYRKNPLEKKPYVISNFNVRGYSFNEHVVWGDGNVTYKDSTYKFKKYNIEVHKVSQVN